MVSNITPAIATSEHTSESLNQLESTNLTILSMDEDESNANKQQQRSQDSILINGENRVEMISETEPFNPREMAIDCPDNFVPEVKTKPCYPPSNFNQQQKNQTQSYNTSTIEKQQKNILKPLLNIINSGGSGAGSAKDGKDVTDLNNSKIKDGTSTTGSKKSNKSNKSKSKSKLNKSERNEEKMSDAIAQSLTKDIDFASQPQKSEQERIELTCQNIIKTKESSVVAEQLNAHLSTSNSSIQYIDEDNKSRTFVGISNSMNASQATANERAHEQPLAASNDLTSAKISLGKKLFDKQKNIVQQQEHVCNEPVVNEVNMRKARERENQFLRQSLRNSEKMRRLAASRISTVTGTVNDGFEMDNEIDEKRTHSADAEQSKKTQISQPQQQQQQYSIKIIKKDQAFSSRMNPPISVPKAPTPPPRTNEKLTETATSIIAATTSASTNPFLTSSSEAIMRIETSKSTLDVNLVERHARLIDSAEHQQQHTPGSTQVDLFKNIQNKSFELSSFASSSTSSGVVSNTSNNTSINQTNAHAHSIDESTDEQFNKINEFYKTLGNLTHKLFLCCS
jgi:hypothetical protein